MIPDTNIVIAHLLGEEVVVQAFIEWKRNGTLFLPTVVESEVLSFSKWDGAERSTTEQFLIENFISVPFDRSIAYVAADIRRTVRIKFPDAAVAASALHLHVPLITRNIKDFGRIPNLDLRTI